MDVSLTEADKVARQALLADSSSKEDSNCATAKASSKNSRRARKVKNVSSGSSSVRLPREGQELVRKRADNRGKRSHTSKGSPRRGSPRRKKVSDDDKSEVQTGVERDQKGRAELLADSSAESGSDEETAEKNELDHSSVERMESSDHTLVNEKGRAELLADDSSEGDNNEEGDDAAKTGTTRDEQLADDESSDLENVNSENRKSPKRLSKRTKSSDESSSSRKSPRKQRSKDSPSAGKKHGKSPVESRAAQKGRAALLADDSSSDEDTESRDDALTKEKNEKARQAMLANSSSENEANMSTQPTESVHKESSAAEELHKTPPSTSKKPKSKAQRRAERKDSKGRKLSFADSSASEDKENIPLSKLSRSEGTEKLPNPLDLLPQHRSRHAEKLLNIKTEVESGGEEAEYTAGFVILGEYDSCTHEIKELDDDLLVQLDGAGECSC